MSVKTICSDSFYKFQHRPKRTDQLTLLRLYLVNGPKTLESVVTALTKHYLYNLPNNDEVILLWLNFGLQLGNKGWSWVTFWKFLTIFFCHLQILEHSKYVLNEKLLQRFRGCPPVHWHFSVLRWVETFSVGVGVSLVPGHGTINGILLHETALTAHMIWWWCQIRMLLKDNPAKPWITSLLSIISA